MIRIFYIALLALFAFAPAAYAADPDTDDVRCVIVYLRMAQSSQSLVQTSGMYGQLYWLGKLDGRNPNYDLESHMQAEIPKMNDALFKSEAMRCSTELMKRGSKEADMGEDLAKKKVSFPAAPAKPAAAAPGFAPAPQGAKPAPAPKK